MTAVVHGHCDSRFSNVADALADEIATGEELGASIALDIEGELVVDIWGGHADSAQKVPWGQDTIVNFFSCTKTLTALAALIAIDRGLVDAFAPVAKYWPEFADNGKHTSRCAISCRTRRVFPAGNHRFPSRTSMTGRRRPAISRVRHRGGHPELRPVITRSTTAIRSAR